MCKNHQHLVASIVVGEVMPSGDVVYIVQNRIDSCMIQSLHGASLQVPCSMTLLMPLHPRAMVFSSPEALMVGLGALCCAWEMIESEPGVEPPTNVISFLSNSLTHTEPGAG